MSPTFEQVVQQIATLPLSEKQGLLKLLDKQIADSTIEDADFMLLLTETNCWELVKTIPKHLKRQNAPE